MGRCEIEDARRSNWRSGEVVRCFRLWDVDVDVDMDMDVRCAMCNAICAFDKNRNRER